MTEIEIFAEQLQNAVIDEAKHGDGSPSLGEDFKENAFTRIVLGDLEDAGVVESPTECYFYFPHPAAKINAYCIPDDEFRLVLVVTDYFFQGSSGVGKLNAGDIDKSFKMAERFFQMVISPTPINVDPGTQARSMIQAISTKKDSFRSVQIILVSNRQLAIRREKARPTRIGTYVISHDVWDLERIKRFRSGGVAHDPIEVDFSKLPGGGLNCLSNEDPLLGYATSIAVIPGAVIAELYDEYGARLLELNVRSYLQAKGKINKGILETLVRTPQRFLAYNNGITIVAEDIIFTDDQSRIAKIVGIQVVNGGQTTASIHRAKKESGADLSHVYVQAKITKVAASEFEEIVPEISRFSNTQNKVNEVDLKANHPFHVGVQRFAENKWVPGEKSKWFYERARGSYQTERVRRGGAGRTKFEKDFPAHQRITKEDLARYSNVFDGYPHIVSRGGQKNFLKFMEGLGKLGKDWAPTDQEFKEIIGKAILFRVAQQIAKDTGVSAFRVNVVSYTVALISFRTEQGLNFGKVWELQDLPDSWKAQIREWMPRIGELLTQGAAGRNPTEWFKLEQCWSFVKDRTATWTISSELQQESAAFAKSACGKSQQAQVEESKKIDAQTWLDVYHWGETTALLNRPQLDISKRLAELAFGGWRKNPTERQANEGMKIIALYEARVIS